ncbi:MAG: hypothetical protein EBS05_25365 [Proteobacteria bacterium]|nr:hypothetical protein [Pseudomonadota bacterium]
MRFVEALLFLRVVHGWLSIWGELASAMLAVQLEQASSPASYRGVPPRVPAGGETPPALAGEDACGTKPTGRFRGGSTAAHVPTRCLLPNYFRRRF